MKKPNKFTRRKPIPTGGQQLRSGAGTVGIGPYQLSAFDAHVLTEFMRNGMKAREAMLACGTPEAGAHTAAYRVFHKPEVMGALNHLLVERRKRVDIELDEVVNYHYAMANADPLEFPNPVVWRCCRYCWGIDNQYQFTQAELRNAYQKHSTRYAKLSAEKRPLFDEEGGVGFDCRRDPQRGPEWGGRSNDGRSCPECNGKGVQVVEEVDLSKLSRGARLIFDGVKVNPNGVVEYKFNGNRSRGMEEVAKLLGLTGSRRTIPLPNFDGMEDGILDALLDEAEGRGLIGPGDYRDLVDVTPDK